MKEVTQQFKKIQVLGYTTDVQQCQCCGKDNLKGTVSIRCLESDVVFYYGVVCAGKAAKYDSLQSAAEAKKEINKAMNKVKSAERDAHSIAWTVLKGKYGVITGQDRYSFKINAPEGVYESVHSQCVAFLLNPANKGQIFKLAN